jgi:hypothetical protein
MAVTIRIVNHDECTASVYVGTTFARHFTSRATDSRANHRQRAWGLASTLQDAIRACGITADIEEVKA